MAKTVGGFTMPGESGYEELTLELAKRWGADVIRDSDGTVLSDDIIHAGYGIYSTICIIRDHNDWAKKNMDKLQSTLLMSAPIVAQESTLTVDLMADYFDQQFIINDSQLSMKYWQVYDRTTNTLVDPSQWSYADGKVTIQDCILYHKYTVSFFAYRIWEEISMYNHTTNNWDKEHLMLIDPIYPETREYMKAWMKNWCETHPDTTVVRFTSMFYNFAWIWGSNERNRHLYSDWGSYDFTTSPEAFEQFKQKKGYELTAENFINQGKLHVTHMPADSVKLDWMDFINEFVVSFGKELVDMVHSYGKKAYVFYDDSWVGVEPWGKRFQEFGFDGLIKCVFSGYEARLCAGVDVPTHELRLHPYLFPVGLGGAPTFMEGGDPTLEAKKYWNSVRRALLRAPIQRIGLGGYLHLVQDYPDFVDYIEKVSDEFREIRGLHELGKPITMKPKVAVLHFWGKLRSWTLSGHFHETYMHNLIQINEALSGLPVDVTFIDFQDVLDGCLTQYDVVINAGAMGDAWSGGDSWKNAAVVDAVTKFVYDGGAFIGVKEPSAVEGFDTTFRMAHVLGVDKDLGDRVSHGRWSYDIEKVEGLIPEGASVLTNPGTYLVDGETKVLMDVDGCPALTYRKAGKGCGIYLGGFKFNLENTRLLLNLILYGAGESIHQEYLTDNANTECAYYPEGNRLVLINNSDKTQTVNVVTKDGSIKETIEPYDTVMKTV